MQSNSTPAACRRPRLLVVELWGVGDLALAVPFLREASRHAQVTLLAKPHAAPLVRRFCPEVELLPLTAPWTAFRGKYRLPAWPWSELGAVVQGLRSRRFAAAVSARRDPRDHLLMALSGAALRAGFPRLGSRGLLTDSPPRPARPHRAEHWRALAAHFGWELPEPAPAPRTGRHVIIHTGAGQPVREWPRERFAEIAARLRADGWRVTLLDDSLRDLDQLLDLLATADRFIGNDSGPGHLAPLLGVPTFTIFGPQLPELFAPTHPQSAWIDGAPCPHKPCFDSCHFATPHCIQRLDVDAVWLRTTAWLKS
ncbi:MAG: glycosyltransferase family 9 protein [Opitutae bacterium]|nr:glycosyltransferase family 9 protein [Opitutae bacterium]